MVAYNGKLPSEFARQPRSLDYLSRWKATEFRKFLLYTGIIVLMKVFSDEMYGHFWALSVAIRIMSDKVLSTYMHLLEFAHSLLLFFVDEAPGLYSNTFVVYNVHSLIHLKEDIINFDSTLSELSAFPFENDMQVLKKYVRKASSPCAQVLKRISELENLGVSCTKKEIFTTINKKFCDSWYLTKTNKILQVERVEHECFLCNVISHTLYESFFNHPIDSQGIGIYKLDTQKLTGRKKLVYRNELKRKFVSLIIGVYLILL